MGWRGAGLGNEIFPWAKAHLASRELGFRLLRPAWGLNRRNYWRDFGTSRLDWVCHAVLRGTMPITKVTDDMVRSTSETDYGAAVRVLDSEYKWSERRRPLILLHESMSGGYLGIERARPYLRNALLGHLPEEDCAASRDAPSGRLRVAVHIRLGDFQADSTGPRPGVFNTRIPFEWYKEVLDTLQRHFGNTLHIDIVSDEPEQIARAFPQWSLCHARSRSVFEDLSLITAADLLVCSVSSFSMLAAFLSDAPYVWYRPQMFDQGGFVSIWGHTPEHQTSLGNVPLMERKVLSAPFRGVPLDLGSDLPGWLTDFLEAKAAINTRDTDLIRYGVAPCGAPVHTPE